MTTCQSRLTVCSGYVVALVSGSWWTATTTGSTTGYNVGGGGVTADANPNGGTTSFGMGPQGDGWHDIEIRMANAGGNAGPALAGYGWTGAFGLGLSSSGSTSADGSNYVKAEDNGSGTLFRNSFTGVGQLIKQGAGTLTLNGANIISGGTTISAGQLVVASGAALGAGQYERRHLSRQRHCGRSRFSTDGGTVSPGTSGAGLLSTSGSVALNAATTYSVELNGNAPGNGTGKYDQLKVTGAVNLGGATLSASTRFTAAETDIFSIVTSTGVLSGTFAGLPDGALLTIGGRAYIIHYATNAATLAVVPNSAPVIDGGDNVALDVLENDTTVKTITAMDTDTPAQTLTYSISGGADAAKFSVDSTSGKLTFQTAPNFEVPTDNDGVNSDNIYNVTVQVSDGTATDSQDLAVTVTDVNEAPVITSNDGGDTAAV